MPYIGSNPSNRFVAPKAASVFSGDGSTTAFTLDHAVGSDEDILVSVDGVIQEPSVAYAVSSGTTLKFTAAPSSNSGNNIFVYYLFRTVGTVSHPSNNALVASNITVDNITIDGTEIDLSSGDLTIDVAGDITLDADGGDVNFQDGGTLYGFMAKSSDNLLVGNAISDGDVLIRGNDGGSNITAVTFDMSDAGKATFNSDIVVDNKVQGASGESLTVESQSGGAVIINTNGANERARITSAGDFLMQTSSSLGNATLHVDAVGSTYVMVGRASTAGGFVLWQKDDGTTIGSIDHTSSATRYLTSSDYRLKENVSYDFDATTRLKQLKPCRFNFKTDKDITVDGFLAHEVSSVVPESVSGEKDAMTKEVLYVDGDEIPKGKKVGDVKEASVINPQGIDQAKLVPLLVKSLQEALAEIDTLKTKVAALESK